ncbi:MAG: hypothetical protein KJ067_24365 [Vicinamibacteria bacterium]|nr:hypothetical protein [Vicinamibacteria bacterium]
MRPDLNLASRPFRNRRLPLLATAALVAAAVALTLLHAALLFELLSPRALERRAEVARLESELRALREQQAGLVVADVPAATQARWKAASGVVERRVFSWTLLLSRLEAALPRDVRLVSIAPLLEAGTVSIEVRAEAENVEAGFAVVARFESQPEFADVRPQSIADGEAGRVEMSYRMSYRPEDVPAPAAAAPEAEARP